MENKGLPIETQNPHIEHADYVHRAACVHHADCINNGTVENAESVKQSANVESAENVEYAENVTNNVVESCDCETIFERAEKFKPSNSDTELSYGSNSDSDLLAMALGLPDRIEIDATTAIEFKSGSRCVEGAEIDTNDECAITYDLHQYIPSRLMPYVEKVIVASCAETNDNDSNSMKNNSYSERVAIAKDSIRTAVYVKCTDDDYVCKRLHDRVKGIYYHVGDGVSGLDEELGVCDKTAGRLYTDTSNISGGVVSGYWKHKDSEALFSLFHWKYKSTPGVGTPKITYIKAISIENDSDTGVKRYLQFMFNTEHGAAIHNLFCRAGTFYVYLPKKEIVAKIKELLNQ